MNRYQVMQPAAPVTLTFANLASLASGAAAISTMYRNTSPYARYGAFQISLKCGATGPVAGTYEVYLIAGGVDGASQDDGLPAVDTPTVQATWSGRSGRKLKSWSHANNNPGNDKVLRETVQVDDLPLYFSVLVMNSATAQAMAAAGSSIIFHPFPIVSVYGA